MKIFTASGPFNDPREPLEIQSGYLNCTSCNQSYLILAGIALLVPDTRDYLLSHVKGISAIVAIEEIPEKYRDEFLEVQADLVSEHFEEDLEAERVNALYLMNHYLHGNVETQWWKPSQGAEGSPLIADLVQKYWDHGPFTQIGTWVSDAAKSRPGQSFRAAVELGCGVGGLHAVIKPHCDFYLGVDSSFASIALARHLALGIPYPKDLRIPEDLLQGGVSREVVFPTPAQSNSGSKFDGKTDFVVMDLGSEHVGLSNNWDLTLSLNMIDMLDRPEELPKLQFQLLEQGGLAIQSCPYIWHDDVAKALREQLPRELHCSSSRAVEWLYQQAGFKIEQKVEHQPWLFFKHLRQIEIYSVHLFTASKAVF